MQYESALLTILERKPENLIRGLRLLQKNGVPLTDAALQAAAEYFQRPLAEVEALVRFYPQFRQPDSGTVSIEICSGASCRNRNAMLLERQLKELLAAMPAHNFTLKTVGCLGFCAQAPALRINGRLVGRVDSAKLAALLQEYGKTDHA